MERLFQKRIRATYVGCASFFYLHVRFFYFPTRARLPHPTRAHEFITVKLTVD